MKGPKLFILARDDSDGKPRLPRVRAQFEKALGPKQLIVLDGSAHAQFLFDTDQGPKTADLAFLTDDDLQASLRADLDQADRAIRDGHWKSATVLAGAVAEALLLWSVRRDWETIEPTIEKKLRSREPEEWDLKDYIAVAHRAKIISEEACRQCELCREFRNLIHPGREKRLGQKATRGRALGALAAVDLVIECLMK